MKVSTFVGPLCTHTHLLRLFSVVALVRIRFTASLDVARFRKSSSTTKVIKSQRCHLPSSRFNWLAVNSESSEPSWLSTAAALKNSNNDFQCHLPLEIPYEDEKRPRRFSIDIDSRYNSYVDPNDWGVEKVVAPEQPQFPSTIDALTDAAFEAIAGTLYNKQRMDPNFASNAMSKSIFGYRPVRSDADLGRIGVEIDGVQHLLPHLSEGSAMRRVALLLAAKLSQGYWDGFEDSENSNFAVTNQKSRPVVVYFNTIKQSLMASQELQLLRRADSLEDGEKPSANRFENVTILCLGQGGEIPIHLRVTKKTVRTRTTEIARGEVDPRRGILLVVQPTDYNDEFQPPGPAIGAIGSLQTLVAQAAVRQLPVVVISPRFLSAHEQELYARWDQSGYQQSATFGGAEPPRGPTPWVMRDFTPPIFCWVARALRRSPRLPHNENPQQNLFSKIALLHSVMDVGHPWHIFAGKASGDYQYVASTKTSSGRPTTDLMSAIFGEWIR